MSDDGKCQHCEASEDPEKMREAYAILDKWPGSRDLELTDRDGVTLCYDRRGFLLAGHGLSCVVVQVSKYKAARAVGLADTGGETDG